ncbi:hypothetical protein GN956_G6678 [Arapaima gigas]
MKLKRESSTNLDLLYPGKLSRSQGFTCPEWLVQEKYIPYFLMEARPTGQIGLQEAKSSVCFPRGILCITRFQEEWEKLANIQTAPAVYRALRKPLSCALHCPISNKEEVL